MKIKRIIIVFILFFTAGLTLQAQEQTTEQQLSEFNLVSYGERGKKLWEISGKSADILSDIVKLTQITASVYGAEETVNLNADEGSFDRGQNKIHLEKNVVITTTKGAKLVTDSLDWDRKTEIVSTKDTVNLERQNMIAAGQGAEAQPNLKKFSLQKDVEVQIKAEEENSPKNDTLGRKIFITCDGPLEVDYEKNLAVFKNKVAVDDGTMQLYSDVMDVYFNPAKDEKSKGMAGIDKIVAKGNVKIVRGENTSYSQEATYLAKDKKIILTGKPKLVIYSTEGLNASP
ncbi:MAG: LPS export ABC transporter periplasmic protein LptC [Candidatus Omnitrophica bacterium]|nr:LPS export ABC transporter periplasmic protein LptC [Candidatus Omnitrophota bacterium]MCM8770695.1 LPS export ABC transporter periplasmic protein LptC [Candidatus Omnitrophota bacterium]